MLNKDIHILAKALQYPFKYYREKQSTTKEDGTLDVRDLLRMVMTTHYYSQN